MKRPVASKIVRLILNGTERTLEVDANETLAEVLREKLRLTGTKIGCNTGDCGACTVVIDGEARLSCLTLAIACEGKDISTIEGLASPKGQLHPIQEAFIEHFAIQCGFCTPGMIMATKALLNRNPCPNEEEIKEAINGNLCRCTGYKDIISAISAAATLPSPKK